MNSLQITLRNMARALGVTKILRWRAGREAARLTADYHRLRPARVTVGVPPHTAEFLVDDPLEYVNLRQKEHDRDILRTMTDALAPGSTCWDIGANIGIYTLIAAKSVGSAGHVLAFEPEPGSRNRLLANRDANKLGNVDVAPVALGAREGVLRMLPGENPSAGDHRILQEAEAAAVKAPLVEVRVVRGDDYRREHALPAPSLVKLDVEGAELDVMHGLEQTLRDPACRTLICEVHFAVLQSRGQGDVPLKIGEFLNACGFTRTHWIDRSHLAAFK